MKFLWIFNGANSPFPSAVFSTEDLAVAWIHKHGLTGTLTQYLLNVPVLDWAIESGWFKPTKPQHEEPRFIQTFTSASQPHRHFVDGISDA